MSPLLRIISFLGLIGLVAAPCADAQNTPAAEPVIDFSDDPCGSPLVESQLWYSLDGKIVSVEDGTTVLMVTKGRRRVRVHVVGIAVEQHGALGEQAKERVSQMVLNRAVEVLVNPDWLYLKKKPTEITGVVQSKDRAEDVGFSLLAKGLARAEEPRPYTMSRYTFCTYRHAESEAESKKLGVWR